MFSEHINPLELNEALESDREDRHDEDWHLIELAAEKWLETHPVNLCDCERSANGIGLAGRECDCPAGVRNRPQTSDSLLIECRDELERLLFNKPGNGTADLIDRLKSAPQPPASRPQEGIGDDEGFIVDVNCGCDCGRLGCAVCDPRSEQYGSSASPSQEGGMREALEAERKRLAKMLNDMAMVYPPGSDRRMAVAIAARSVGRGRQLTSVEQMNNLKSAMAEWDRTHDEDGEARESEREACEAICQRVMENWRAAFKEGATGVAACNQASGAEQCLNAISARKGQHT